jgi:hypothetical protein
MCGHLCVGWRHKPGPSSWGHPAGPSWLASCSASAELSLEHRPSCACCSSFPAVHLHRQAPERRRVCDHHQLWAGGYILWPHSRHPGGCPSAFPLLKVPARLPASPHAFCGLCINGSILGHQLAATPAGCCSTRCLWLLAGPPAASQRHPTLSHLSRLRQGEAGSLFDGSGSHRLPTCARGRLPDGDQGSGLIDMNLFAVRSSPAVAGRALSPTTAATVIRPPIGGPWESYRLTLCPVGGPSGGCVVITCPTTSCPVSGLKAETSYVVQASLQWNACATRCAALRCAVLSIFCN